VTAQRDVLRGWSVTRVLLVVLGLAAGAERGGAGDGSEEPSQPCTEDCSLRVDHREKYGRVSFHSARRSVRLHGCTASLDRGHSLPTSCLRDESIQMEVASLAVARGMMMSDSLCELSAG
jgi:hypothetical protein